MRAPGTGCMCATAVLPRVTSVYGTMSSLSVAVRSLYPKNSVTVSAARALAAPRGAALGQACETTLQRRIAVQMHAGRSRWSAAARPASLAHRGVAADTPQRRRTCAVTIATQTATAGGGRRRVWIRANVGHWRCGNSPPPRNVVAPLGPTCHLIDVVIRAM